jgi:hypothetical protein
MARVILGCVFCLTVVNRGLTGINVKDILDVNYLPGTFILDNMIVDKNSNGNITSTRNNSVGNWNDAFSMMDFHR